MRKFVFGLIASLIAGVAMAQDRAPPKEALIVTSCNQIIAAIFVYDEGTVVLDETSGVPAEVVLIVARAAGNVRGYEVGCYLNKTIQKGDGPATEI
jgi:hypothetical protein